MAASLINSAQELDMKASTYFARQDKEELPYSKPGLCLALGYSDVNSMGVSFAKRKEDDEIWLSYKKAILRIEEQYINRVGKSNSAGNMFLLKASYGYRDHGDEARDKSKLGLISITLGRDSAGKNSGVVENSERVLPTGTKGNK